MMSDKTPTERIAEVTNPIKQRVDDIKTPINRVADTLKRRYSEDAPAGVAAIKAAGQFAVGIGDPIVLKGADYIVGSTSALDLTEIEKVFEAGN